MSVANQSQMDDEPLGGHIMISYQWSDQAVLKDVRDNLKASGFKVNYPQCKIKQIPRKKHTIPVPNS